jgi:hypothetical protein
MNELFSVDIPFELLEEFDHGKNGLTLSVEVLDTTYFLRSSWVLKRDTVTYRDESGKILGTEVLQGIDNILANKLIIRNNSDSVVYVPIEDNQLVLVQEAKDQDGNWKPIEYFIHSDCGVSYSSFNIRPWESCEFKIAKYCGNFTTTMRVRMSMNHQIYLSEEFEGSLNYSQFTTSERIPTKGFLRDNLFNKDAY